jgi:hypothetical protein
VFLVGREQLLDLGTELAVSVTDLLEVLGALVGAQVTREREDLFDARVPIGALFRGVRVMGASPGARPKLRFIPIEASSKV